MNEPGAAGRALPQDAGRGSRLEDRRWKAALPGKIAPGRRTRPHGLPIGPTFGNGSVRDFAGPCPFGDRKARRQSREFAQALADMTEVDRWFQPLDQTEHIALGVTGRIHQPLPPWLTIRISPLPRRYFRLSFVLSFRSSFHGGSVRSSTTAQCTLSRSSSISGSLMVAPCVWAQELGCLALGFSSPLPCPPTARRSRCKGARNAREPRDEPLSARASLAGAILFSFAHPAKVRRRWREQEIPTAIMGRLINGQWKAGGSGITGGSCRREASPT